MYQSTNTVIVQSAQEIDQKKHWDAKDEMNLGNRQVTQEEINLVNRFTE